ncbi:MAG: DUF5132 domain-containing protein [Symploca sp. SIO3C6]|uniref:DUF5132 domain-containing protein n=1 Tax=Symploca sp. SIO1C4 TaxID=2607765 RepID=A0A6B3N5W7_9CYAN|nr:DUF5132 domain-containing protein [Symploca sp. SIO3C6]NER26185.1 DUF5132 domain-containing protein [Symploca sp. SIO1C4]NET04847.1 DUF5132 domain-containing protein [Symploca sp. SIO2B6]NET53665.1 DUF5132 domain-containing protein [Merismopedia sp. SIO2A8]
MDLDLDDLFEDFGLPGLVIGVGAILLAPIVGPALAKVGKPAAKAAMKTGIVFYEKSKVVVSEASEAFQDLLVESKAELASEAAAKTIEVATTEVTDT